MIEFLHRRRNENDKMIDDKQPSEDVVVVVPDPHLLEENEANANGFFGQHYLSIAPPRPLTSTSHVKWAVAHGDILIQQRSFESQRALTACWQTSRENGLFPCILCDQSVHFLTLNTPPTCMPLAEPYDGIFAFGPGVLLHNSETNAMALIRAPFHVEVTPETLETPVDHTTILWTSARFPLFLARHQSVRSVATLYTVSDSRVVPLHMFSASSADPSPPSPACSRSAAAVVLSPDGQNHQMKHQRLRLPDGSWVLLMQSNDGGMVVLQSGRDKILEETTSTETPKTTINNDVDMEAGMDAQGNHAYEAMLESVDSERRRRAANCASSLNVLDAGVPTEDVQNLPFHLAYAVLVERRGAEGLNEKTGSQDDARDDTRAFEARELLSSTRPVVLKSREMPGADDDGNIRHQQQLLQASRRTLALALGRGAMDLGTYDALPTEMLESPDIDLSGRIVERNDAIVTLDLSSDPQAPGGGALSERTAWPEFQNGTASALRINRNISNLSRTWIVYNKPKTPSYDHAGFLFGLGLTGQLACLTVTDLYRYLSHEHDATLVGVLLGMSASKKASMDATLTKMLFLHLPSQHPMGYPDLEIAPVVQCAGLLGVGMLFQGTGQRSIAEMLLGEIDSGGAGDDVKKGGGYSLMAGFGLGLVMGTGKVNDCQELYEEELGWLMKGGRKKKGKDADIRKEEKKKGGNAVQEELLASQRRPRTLLEQGLVPQGSKDGACVALGMIWMRSMEERVFDMMALEAHLDPEDVTLRVWMRCLIMWDHDLRTWLDMNQIGGHRAGTHSGSYVGREGDMNAAGNRAGDASPWDAAHLMNELGRSLGVHLALACKFAGRANETMRDSILERVDWMLETKLRATDAAVKEVVETAICFSVLSAAVVMTGTRDLKTFGYVRALMNCSGLYCGNVWYEVLGLGAGLLFHGADHPSGESTISNWSFGSKPEDLAYLIIALYPSSTPDKYWSFCRHLWVLSGGLAEAASPAQASVRDEISEDESMAMESVMLRIRSCGKRCSESDVQGLLDVYLTSCADRQIADAVVESLVDRLLVSTRTS